MASPPSTTHNHHLRPTLPILIPFAAIPSAFLLLLLLLLLFFHFSRQTRHPTLPISSPSPILHHFSSRSINTATLNFHPSRSLGRNPSSSVFRATLPDGRSLAVKRVPSSSPNELHLLSQILPSPFIVPLLGYSHSLLVFEYMCNGSLQDALFSSSRPFIHWDRRFRIVLDVAKALAFLHFECQPPVIHGDVKPSNVLLDVDFRAKLADFGLSRRKVGAFATQDVGLSSPLDDGSGEVVSSSSGSRDYVSEWIGDQVCSSNQMEGFEETSLDEIGVKDKVGMSNVEGGCDKERKMREWWKEEYFAEICKSGKKSKGFKWFRNNKLGEIDGSFRKGWKKSKEQLVGSEMMNGDVYSKELISTTSMRGTVCYVAPEYGGFCNIDEKADVYSFGVLVLVVVSGRRPLHVQESPMKLDRANLISWCRQLAVVGDVLEILDEKLKGSCNMDQVNLCINLALLCLQKTPELRPDSGEIVKILNGEMEIPVVPLESWNSPINLNLKTLP